MPRRKDIKKVLVIGSGPIVIGQAAEFDYAGTQACLALKEEGYEVILANSNPATIMTDTHIADKVYMEPLTLEYVAKIIRFERPDAIVPGLGGQTGLNLAMELYKSGFLREHGVRLIGTNIDAILKSEDRQLFKDAMAEIGQPTIPSRTAETLPAALAAAARRRCSPSPPLASTPRPYTRCWSRSTSSAGRRSSSRSCATPPAPR